MENFHAEWAACLLEGIEDNCSPEVKRACLEHCAGLHYRVNNMEQQLEKYVGDLDGFIEFLHNEYGWIVSIDKENNRLLVDENKDYCVCPITAALQGNISPALCDCSAHYARKMFSKVLGRDVQANVQRSFLRDGLSCVYEIILDA